MKTHLNFATTDLARSIAFYETLLDAKPTNAGLASSIERQETCCYANQTKVWANDPEGRRWEIYTVHEDSDIKTNENTSCCADDAGERSCCVA